MAEYTKVKELDEGFQMDDDEEKSPPVVDPQGLEGCSPGPGQRHINGMYHFLMPRELLFVNSA